MTWLQILNDFGPLVLGVIALGFVVKVLYFDVKKLYGKIEENHKNHNEQLLNCFASSQGMWSQCKACKEQSVQNCKQIEKEHLEQLDRFYNTMRTENTRVWGEVSKTNNEICEALNNLGTLVTVLSTKYDLMLERLKDIKEGQKR